MALLDLRATFSVDTDHTCKLEQVLSDGDRDQYEYYEGKLVEMLIFGFINTTAKVSNTCNYGSVLVGIEFTDINELPLITQIFENTVKHWCHKYGINEMGVK